MMHKNERLMKAMLDNDNVIVTTLLEKLRRTSDFKNELSFGTGGVRGEVGIGTDKINNLTIAKLALDVANYIQARDKKEQGALIFYDTRYSSKHFADLTAKLLMEKNIEVCVSANPSPTPVLSYAVNRHDYFLGIMITASHNPYTDNGFKVYNESGNQFTDKDLEFIQSYLNTNFFEAAEAIKVIAKKQYSINTTILYEEEYQQYLEKSLGRMQKNRKLADLEVVYSPLHGAGYSLTPKISKALPFLELIPVQEQMVLDGFFKTLRSPNPEYADSFHMAFQLARECEVDTVLLTDPDVDRLGAAVKYDEFKIYSGNELGILFLTFLLEITWKENQGTILSTIVSSDLPDLIAQANGLKIKKTLTGFKYIGEYISSGINDFYFAFEESGGFLFFDKIRDKDGIQAAMVFSIMKAYYDGQNKHLEDKLQEIYNEYGYFTNRLTTSKTIDFNQLSERIYQALSANHLSEVWAIEDYQTQKRYKAGEWTVFNKYPTSPVLKIYFSSYEWIAFRPSGTEKYFKIYQQSWGKDLREVQESQTNIQDFIDYFVNSAF